MFSSNFGHPHFIFAACYSYLKLNGKIASLDKAITVEDIGLF